MLEYKDSPFMRYSTGDEIAASDPAEAYARHAEICGIYFSGLPEAKAGYRYAPGKWTVREVVGHLADADLIFLYRLVCIARGEKKELPGFEENEYVATADFDALPWRAVLESWRGVSAAISGLLAGIDAEGWKRMGVANGTRLTPRDMLSTLMAHERHHIRVLKERYGLG